MTDSFIFLAAVTIVCAGGGVPCFFKSSRVTAGCLLMSGAVLSATAVCFLAPVKVCLASFSSFDILYFSILFAAAFFVSLFYRPLLAVAAVLYILWCAVFFIILLSSGYTPSASLGEITVTSDSDSMITLKKITLSPYQLLPCKMIWCRKNAAGEDPGISGNQGVNLLYAAGAVFSVEEIQLPASVTYPHVYSFSVDADGLPVFETIF